MKKKLPLSLAAIGMAGLLTSATAAFNEPEYVWGNLLTGIPGQDQTRGIATSGTDAVYWMAFNGSWNGDTDVTYGGQILYDGIDFDGTTANKNLTLLKTNASGEEQWIIYSSAGDFISGEGNIEVNSKGEVIFFGTVRHTEGKQDKGICLTDRNGYTIDIGWDIGDRRNKRLFLASASSEGELLWAKTYEVSTDPLPNGSGINANFTADAINACSLTIDDEDNIYIGGRYRNNLTFPKAGGGEITLKPKNISTWDGDAQKGTGDMYIVKLDRDGNYLAHLTEGGAEVEVTYTWDLVFKNSHIYMSGYSKGNGDDSVEINGVNVVPTKNMSPIIAKLDKDLKPVWLTLLPGGEVNGKNTIQNVSLSISNRMVWLTGMYNGRISNPEDADEYVESTQGNLREGFIIKLDEATGNWMASANSRTDFNQNYLTGYLKIINEEETGTEDIMVYGYVMNSTIGVFLRSYNSETLTGIPDKSWSLVSQGGVPTAVDLCYVPELASAYLTVRGNKAFQPLGGPLSDSVSGFTNFLSRFELPLPIQTSNVNIKDEEGETIYYTIQGLRVIGPKVPGLYIRQNGKHRDKIFVR